MRDLGQAAPEVVTYVAWGALLSVIQQEWRELHRERRLAALEQRANPERHAYALRQLLAVRRIALRAGREFGHKAQP